MTKPKQSRKPTLKQVRKKIAEAVRSGKVDDEIVGWLDHLRQRGWAGLVAPFDYNDMLCLVREEIPDLERGDWDEFLALCDVHTACREATS